MGFRNVLSTLVRFLKPYFNDKIMKLLMDLVKWVNVLGLPDCHLVHVASSVCAGLVAATMGTPADVVKTRIMNQPVDSAGRGLLYKGSVDCLMQTVSKEGFFALYKGFLPVWIRMAPWSLTFWLSFEQIRSMLGIGGY